MRKYKLTDETKTVNGATLYRIEALRDFNDVKAGDRGGFVKCEENLSHRGTCWIYDDATATDCTRIMDDATMHGQATMRSYSALRNHEALRGHSSMSDYAAVFRQ